MGGWGWGPALEGVHSKVCGETKGSKHADVKAGSTFCFPIPYGMWSLGVRIHIRALKSHRGSIYRTAHCINPSVPIQQIGGIVQRYEVVAIAERLLGLGTQGGIAFVFALIWYRDSVVSFARTCQQDSVGGMRRGARGSSVHRLEVS